MAVISVMSAKGAPGVTTTALLLATLWPASSILLDADPLGGDVALRLLRSDGRAMDPERGLLSLLPAARRGLDPVTVAQHTQEAVGGQPVLAGLPGPEQALAIAPLWPTLAEVFTRVPNADVFIDAGQVQSRSDHLPLVQHSDQVLLVYRPTAWSALHTRHRVESLSETLRDHDVRIGIVGVADADQEQDRQTAAAAIRAGYGDVVDFGRIAYDPRAVVMFEGAVVYRPERTLLARSGRTVAERLYSDLASVHAVPEGRPEDAGAPGTDQDPNAQPEAMLPGAESAPRRGRRRAVRRLREPKGVS
jgi:MinD-like ATPase involved in chromosome partitioning or flagellar assembly